MVRTLSVYLAVAATLLLLLGLFLPAGRGLAIIEFGNGQVTEVGQLQAEEMGCAPTNTGNSIRPVFLTNFDSFFNSEGVLCGKSSLSMLLTGKYWWANVLLIIPALIALYAILRLFFQPYARNHDRNLMLISGLISLMALSAWWGIWVKFRAYPGIGYWISLVGALMLFVAGLLAPQVDAFREKHHPHQA
jgi:hypothetical protein